VSITAPDPLRTEPLPAPRAGDDTAVDDDTVVVTCAACNHRQRASGRSPGYTCEHCGSIWRVLRCRGCRQVSVVLEGVTECPGCGHAHGAPTRTPPSVPAWVVDPTPLCIWLGGARYLGGHADRDEPITAAGLLLDPRGIHVRAFADLFTIPWTSVRGVDVEGPVQISERLTMSRLVAMGASTWVTTLSYLTVSTAQGDLIFEIDGLAPPELRTRLARVLHALERAAPPPAPIATGSAAPVPAAPEPVDWVEPVPLPDPVDWDPSVGANEPAPLALEPGATDAPLEVLVVDALWKLAQLRDAGLLGAEDVAALRDRLLARLPRGAESDGPLLRV
jgi:hypothetical protein